MKGAKPYILRLFLSNKYSYAQIMHKPQGHIVAAASSLEKTLREELPSTSDQQVCGGSSTTRLWLWSSLFYSQPGSSSKSMHAAKIVPRVVQASKKVGQLLAERARGAGVPAVHWARKHGQRYHGRIKELLQSMTQAGLPLN